MKRRAALINHLHRLKSTFPIEFAHVGIESIEIYIDVEQRKERKEIVKILREYKKRLVMVVLLMLENKRDGDYYAAEPYGTVAMKFKNGRLNSRIYCLEFSEQGEKKKIVMVYGVMHKPSTKLSKADKEQIKSIKDYEYEFFKLPKDAIKHREK
jgi:hypothetical protein